MHPQWANILLQGLGRRVLTVVAIGGPHCQIKALHWHYFISCDFTLSAKSSLESRPVDTHKPVEALSMHIYLV